MTELEFREHIKIGMKVRLSSIQSLEQRKIIVPSIFAHDGYRDATTKLGINTDMLPSFGKTVTVSYFNPNSRSIRFEIEEDGNRGWVYQPSWIEDEEDSETSIKLSFDDLFSGNFKPASESAETNCKTSED